MDKKDLFSFGKILRRQGTVGQVRVLLDADDVSKYASLAEVILEQGDALKTLRVESSELHGDRTLTLKLAGIDTLEEADKLKGKTVFLPLAFLPQLAEGLFYHHEVSGFTLVDEKLGPIGVIRGITELPHQKLIEFEHDEKEFLLPLTAGFYLGIDRNSRIIRVHLPDGLLNLYDRED